MGLRAVPVTRRMIAANARLLVTAFEAARIVSIPENGVGPASGCASRPAGRSFADSGPE